MWQIQVLFLELSGIFFPDSFDPQLAESEDGEFRADCMQ